MTSLFTYAPAAVATPQVRLSSPLRSLFAGPFWRSRYLGSRQKQPRPRTPTRTTPAISWARSLPGASPTGPAKLRWPPLMRSAMNSIKASR
jgi:hypothetical protein